MCIDIWTVLRNSRFELRAELVQVLSGLLLLVRSEPQGFSRHRTGADLGQIG